MYYFLKITFLSKSLANEKCEILFSKIDIKHNYPKTEK